MALVLLAGAGFGSVLESNTTSGTNSIVAEEGYYMRTAPTTTNAGYFEFRRFGTNGDQTQNFDTAILGVRFRFRLGAANTSVEPFLECEDNVGPTRKATLRLSSGGIVTVRDTGGALVASGTTVLTTNQWYVIGFVVDTGPTAAYTLTINGVTELTGTMDSGTNNHGRLRLGKTTNINNGGVDYHYRDLVVDNASIPTVPLSSRQVTLPAIANGTTMQWTGGTGSSDFSQVGEIGYLNTTYVKNTTSAGDVALFKFLPFPPVGITGLRIQGNSGAYASCPDSAALDITGDIDLRWCGALDNWLGGTTAVVAKWNTTGNQRSYALDVLNDGKPYVFWSTDGTAANQLSMAATTALPATNGQPLWVRATLDVDDGSGNRVANFYYSTDPITSTPTWTQLGTTVTTAGTTSIFSGTAVVEIGTFSAGTAGLLPGTHYRAQIRNGINGTVVFDPDITDLATLPRTFTERSSNAATVTLNGSAYMINGGTINAVKVIHLVRDESFTTSTKLRHVSGGTTTDLSPTDLTVTDRQRCAILTTDPDTGKSWTLAGLATFQSGMVENNASVASRISGSYLVVSYVPQAMFTPPGLDQPHATQFSQVVSV